MYSFQKFDIVGDILRRAILPICMKGAPNLYSYAFMIRRIRIRRYFFHGSYRKLRKCAFSKKIQNTLIGFRILLDPALLSLILIYFDRQNPNPSVLFAQELTGTLEIQISMKKIENTLMRFGIFLGPELLSLILIHFDSQNPNPSMLF